MIRPVRAITAALSILVAFQTAPAMARGTVTPDRIVPWSGQQITGITITSAEVTGVTYSKFSGGGPTRRMLAEEIKEISWGDAPANFKRALKAYEEQDYEQARRYLEKPTDREPRAFWYEPYKEILQGNCLLKLHKYRSSLPRFDAAIRHHPQSFYVLGAIQGKAQAHLALKQYDSAADTYQKLDPNNLYQNVGSPEPYGKLRQLRGRQGMAEAYVNIQEKRAQAAKLYDGLVKVTKAILADPPAKLKGSVQEIKRIHQESLIGKADVLLKSGKADEAREWLNSASPSITNNAARVRMYMTLAKLFNAAAEKQSSEKEKKVKYKKALLAYMRVYLLYPEQKAVCPRAMLGAAMTSHLLGSPRDNSRAVRIGKALRARFPDTPSAKEVVSLLEGLGVKVSK